MNTGITYATLNKSAKLPITTVISNHNVCYITMITISNNRFSILFHSSTSHLSDSNNISTLNSRMTMTDNKGRQSLEQSGSWILLSLCKRLDWVHNYNNQYITTHNNRLIRAAISVFFLQLNHLNVTKKLSTCLIFIVWRLLEKK